MNLYILIESHPIFADGELSRSHCKSRIAIARGVPARRYNLHRHGPWHVAPKVEGNSAGNVGGYTICVCVCLYIYTYLYIHMYIYIHTYKYMT